MTPTDRDYAGYSEDDLEQTLIWKHRQESSLYGRRKNYWKGKHPLEWAVFFFTVLAFVAAASAALYTRNEVVVMHDQEQRQLRGYVYATVKGPFVIGQKGTFPVQFDILGQTPVYHVHIVMNGGSSCSGVFQFQGKAWKKDMFVDVLFPGDDDVWNEMDFPISKNDIPKLSDNKCALITFGEILYLDAFSLPHFTTFCYLWDPFNNLTYPIEKCPNGNTSDGEEDKYRDILQNPRQPYPWPQ